MRHRALLVSALALGATEYACGARTPLDGAPVSNAGGGRGGGSSLPAAGRAETGGGGATEPRDAGGGAAAPRDADAPDAQPPDAADAPRTIALTAGGSHTCALDTEGYIRCWGANDAAQLGDGSTIDRSTPATRVDLAPANVVAAHDRFTCALLRDGSVACWGYAVDRRLGSKPDDPDPPYGTSPVRVPLTRASDLSHGSTGGQACALSGSLYCWGGNLAGQLARGFLSTSEPAGMMSVGAQAAPFKAATGTSDTCIATFSGSLYCSGSAPGNGQKDATALLTLVAGVTDAADVGIGDGFGCVRLSPHGVRCWGRNDHGELGDGTQVERAEPADVLDIDETYAMSVGAHHACVIVPGPVVRCWGANDHGQLGDGTTNDAARPVAPRVADVIEVAAGDAHTCGRHTTGDVECWGANSHGQLGNGTFDDSAVPVAVVGLH